MNSNYKKWIETNIKNEGLGQCKEATVQMKECFPELTRIRGHYYCPIWGEREHWWLTTPQGEIIDPTVAQFPSKGIGHYEPWNESKKEPTGKCPNCGDYCYNGKTVCSDRCYEEYKNYLESLV